MSLYTRRVFGHAKLISPTRNNCAKPTAFLRGGHFPDEKYRLSR